jgi:hypothetical protein
MYNYMYNYQCNQCLSPLMLWVRTLFMARCTTLCDKVCQWLAKRSVVFFGSSSFLHQKNWPPRYNWNIVESGVKHHQTNKHISETVRSTKYLLWYYRFEYFKGIQWEKTAFKTDMNLHICDTLIHVTFLLLFSIYCLKQQYIIIISLTENYSTEMNNKI